MVEIVCWLGGRGQAQGLPLRECVLIGGQRAGTGPEPAVVAAGDFAARRG